MIYARTTDSLYEKLFFEGLKCHHVLLVLSRQIVTSPTKHVTALVSEVRVRAWLVFFDILHVLFTLSWSPQLFLSSV